MILPTTLCLAAAAALVNIWISTRIGKMRHQVKVSVGDGGNELLMRRMRAQANFIENAPLTLILVGLVEAAGHGGLWLPIAGGLFILGRITHAIGMDGNFRAGRPIGMITSQLFQLVLIVVAVLIAARVI